MLFEFVKGDEVVLKTRPANGTGVITDVLRAGAEPQYQVRFASGSQVFSARHLESAVTGIADATDPIELLKAGELTDAKSFRAFMTLAKLKTPLADNLYSFAASRTERLPHQFKPVLRLLASPYDRLLIADEVGLGKTIEAGIILTELSARGSLDHVLVVCPPALTQKWRREMRNRFLLDFEVLNGESLREFVWEDHDSISPEPRRVIASIELMRHEDNLEALGTVAPNLDVVIVDEAHHMRNIGTASNELGEVLTGLAGTAVFLTATPLNLGRDDFFQLMHLLVPEEFPDQDTFASLIAPNEHINLALRHLRASWPPLFGEALDELRQVEATESGRRFKRSTRYLGARAVLERGARGSLVEREEVVRCQRDLIELNTLSHVFTRTRKREVQELFPMRRSGTVSVDFTGPEQDFYNAVTDWALETYADRAAHLVAATFQRLAASCLPALGRRLTETVRTGELLIGADEAAELADDDNVDARSSDEALVAGDVAVAVEASAARRLLQSWESYRGKTDTKFDRFREALMASYEEGADRILVFSYFTGTIDYLANRLRGSMTSDGRSLHIERLYGPMGAEQRERAVAAFRDESGPVVLLSSEVGSEGLDFQFCSRMFDYDLPWNPMRVEQRIGRLDRYGQASEVIHIRNMIVADTIEERIFYRLYERIEIFESSIGDLEAILGEIEVDLGSLQRDALSGRLTDEELEERRNTIADVIIRRQQDNEEFEEESRQFLSNDDIFSELFNDIERSKRYITPDELALLVSTFLSVSESGVRLIPMRGQAGVFRLTGNVSKFRAMLSRRLAGRATGARATRAFLGRLQDDGLEVTFDPAIATSQRGLDFISLHHPVVSALAASAEMETELASAAALQLELELPTAEPCGFFIYELEAQGMKDELELVCVIGSQAGEVVGDGARLLGSLADARDYDSPALLSWVDVDAMQGAAFAWIVSEVKRRESVLQARNDETVAAQIESLEFSTGRKRLWLQQQIEEGRSQSILRMRRAQLGRLESDIAGKLVTLEDKRAVTLGHRLVAAGVVIDRSGGPGSETISNNRSTVS